MMIIKFSKAPFKIEAPHKALVSSLGRSAYKKAMNKEVQIKYTGIIKDREAIGILPKTVRDP